MTHMILCTASPFPKLAKVIIVAWGSLNETPINTMKVRGNEMGNTVLYRIRNIFLPIDIEANRILDSDHGASASEGIDFGSNLSQHIPLTRRLVQAQPWLTCGSEFLSTPPNRPQRMSSSRSVITVPSARFLIMVASAPRFICAAKVLLT